MLYEVAVVEVPYRQEGENSDLGEIILAPKAVMARNAETAKIIALQGLTLSKPENTVVLVRPFVTR